MELRDIIRTKRKAAGMSMRDLGEKIGVSHGTISRWESGDISSLHGRNALALCQVLNIPLSLFGVDPDGQKYVELARLQVIMKVAFDELDENALKSIVFDPKDPKDAALFDTFKNIADMYDLSDLENSLLTYYRSATPEAQKSAFMVLRANQKEASQ